MQRSRMSSLVAVAGIAIAVSAQAGVNDNLVVNPEFATDLNGWISVAGSVTHSAAEGSPDPGSLRIDVPAGQTIGHARQCVNLNGATRIRLGSRFRATSPGTYGTQYSRYNFPGCEGAPASIEINFTVTEVDGWSLAISDPYASAASASVSVEPMLQTDGTTAVSAFFDHMEVSVVGIPVTLQSFNVD